MFIGISLGVCVLKKSWVEELNTGEFNLRKPIRLVIVEDIVENLKLYEKIFQGVFEIQSYQSGEELIADLPNLKLELTSKSIPNHLTPDLFLIDWHLPKMNGHELFREIKIAFPHTPIIMITAHCDENNMLLALEDGAVDFVVKPISNSELIARIQNKVEKSRSKELIQFHEDNYSISILGNSVVLNKKEYLLLKYLAQFPNRLVSRFELMEKIWNAPNVNSTTLDTHLSILRKKLGDHSFIIHTVKGHGYQMNLRDTRVFHNQV